MRAISCKVLLVTCIVTGTLNVCTAIHANGPSRPLFATTIQKNDAIIHAAVARYKMELWKLDKLRSLQRQGYTTWLEVRRQRLKVEIIEKQISAWRQFAEFTVELDQANRVATQTNDPAFIHQAPAEGTQRGRAIKLVLHGSNRLVGWIDANGPGVSATTRSAEFSEIQHDLETAVEQATKAVEKADRKWKISQNAERVDPEMVQHAALWREMTFAELSLKQVELQEFLDGDQRLTLSNDVSFHEMLANILDQHAADSQILTPFANPELAAATIRVAKHEANADGRLNAALIELEIAELRFSEVEKLHSRGYVESRSLGVAEKKVEEARQWVDQIRTKQMLLQRQFHRLQQQGPLAKNEASQSTVLPRHRPEIDAPALCLPVLGDADATEHLLQLKRSYYQALADREGIALKLEMLRELLIRFDQSTENRASDASPTENSANNQLEFDLRQGEHNQRHKLRLNIRLQEALLAHTEQTMESLSLEQQRFLIQCAESPRAGQIPGADRSTSKSRGHHALLIGFASNATDSIRINYLESREFDPFYLSQPIFPDCDIDKFGVAYQLHEARSLGWRPEYLARRTRHAAAGTSIRHNSRLRPAGVRAIFDENILVEACPEPDRSRDFFHTNRDAFPYGQLRYDLRHRITYGQFHWYRPGFPTILLPENK